MRSKRRSTFDFGTLPSLRRLSVNWVPGFETLVHCQELKGLGIDRPPGPDLRWLEPLTNLRSLDIGSSSKLASTTGVEFLSKLEHLQLDRFPALRDLRGIGELPELDILRISSTNRIDSIDEVAAAATLRALGVNSCGGIASLAPVRHLERLESFFAIESTNILDADLSPLLALPRLAKFGMRSRRSYRPSVEAVHQHIKLQSQPAGLEVTSRYAE